MTMPGFEQAKEDWLSHDDWQYADRDACWKFFYSAGQSDGKAIPMKYRRMEFNAQLQAELVVAKSRQISGSFHDEVPTFQQGEPVHEVLELITAEDCRGYVNKIVELQQQLVAAREEIKTLQANLRMARWERAESELIEQLAISQADNEQLREALSLVRKYRVADSDAWVGKVDKALSTKPDNSVLREHEAQLLEKVIAIYTKDRVESEPDVAGWLENIVSEIRGGKFK